MSNMFNDYKKSFADQKARQEERAEENKINPVRVGSGSALILGINPTEEHLTEIIGDVAKKFDTKYNTTPDQYNDNKPSRPITIWITDKDKQVSPTIQTIRLVDSPREFSTGNKQWYTLRQGSNENGAWTMLVTSWGKDKEVGQKYTKTSAAGNEYTDTIISQVRIGEEQYYDLLKVVTKWPEDATFLEAMAKEGLDFDTAVGGDFDGLRRLVSEFINGTRMTEVPADEEGRDLEASEEVEDLKTFIGIFTAKIKDDGTARQSFCMNSDTWFPDNYGVLTKGMRGRIEELREARLNRDGKDIIKDAYTLDPLVEYSAKVVKQDFAQEAVDVDNWGF